MKTDSLLGTLLKYFVQGLILISPIAITVWVVFAVITYFDNLLEDILPFHFPGLGILVVFGLIVFMGFVATNLLSKSAESYLESWVQKTPVIKVIYFAVKDIVSAMVDKEKRFDRPVMVKLSEDTEVYKLGFITQEDVSELGFGDDMVCVFLPHSYNISGNQFFVPKRNVKVIDQSSSEIMKFVMSGGMAKLETSRKKKSDKPDGQEETNT